MKKQNIEKFPDHLPKRMSDAEMIAAGNDLVISYTISSANGTQKPPRREQNCKKKN